MFRTLCVSLLVVLNIKLSLQIVRQCEDRNHEENCCKLVDVQEECVLNKDDLRWRIVDEDIGKVEVEFPVYSAGCNAVRYNISLFVTEKDSCDVKDQENEVFRNNIHTKEFTYYVYQNNSTGNECNKQCEKVT